MIGQVAAEGAPVAYNPAGQIVSLARSNDAYAWTAHALFERDYAVNGLNQYTSAGGASFAYDGRGNLTQSGGSAYGYTRLNELKTAPNLAAGGTVALGYDTSGRLSQYTAAGSTTSMLYSGPNLVGEIGTAGTLLRRYVHGPGTDEPIVWYEGAGTTERRFLAADQLGSVAAVSDGSGAMLGINRYDEYGIPQAGNIGRFQYTGQTWFGEIGLYNYKARWYSATLGRFMQVDPIGYKDNLNLYAYVGNDPINSVDPSGLERVCSDGQGGVPRCVYVDGNGDGNSRDNDLSSRQERMIANSYGGFIQDNNGKDISRNGLNVLGSSRDSSDLRIASQFVGSVIPGGWRNTTLWLGNGLGSDTAASTDWVRYNGRGDGTYNIVVNMSFGQHRSNYSDIARTLIHEAGHRSDNFGMETLINAQHRRLDSWARSTLMSSGLGGTGCSAIGGIKLFGDVWFANYPGC